MRVEKIKASLKKGQQGLTEALKTTSEKGKDQMERKNALDVFDQ
jgi:hypothetical protein